MEGSLVTPDAEELRYWLGARCRIQRLINSRGVVTKGLSHG
jgi:hypothetical protein